jgi:hypothetical protein
LRPPHALVTLDGFKEKGINMTIRDDHYRFLTIYGQLPARLSTEQTAWVLGFSAHDIPVLVAAGLLKPLGRPPIGCMKYFAAVDLQTLRNDTRWLAKASGTLVNRWRTKNAGRPGQAPRENGDTGCDR